LPTPEIAFSSYYSYVLVKAANVNAKPSFAGAAHIRSDDASGDFLADIFIGPMGANRSARCTWPNNAATSH